MPSHTELIAFTMSNAQNLIPQCTGKPYCCGGALAQTSSKSSRRFENLEPKTHHRKPAKLFLNRCLREAKRESMRSPPNFET